jgi:hypothetical protein
MTEPERNSLEEEIHRQYRWFNTGSRFWSTAHHGSLYLAAILSGSSALVLKVDSLKAIVSQPDFAAVLSAISALLGTLAAAGGFQRKWQANRMNRGDLEQLLVDLGDPAVDANVLRSRLKEIIERHNKAITGQ